MNHFVKLFCIALILNSCVGAERADVVTRNVGTWNYELVKVDSLSFRRAYHGHDTLVGDEYDAFINRNPEYSGDSKSLTHHTYSSNLIAKDIILDGNLNVSNIDTLPENFNIQVSSNKELKIETNYLENPDQVDVPSIEMIAFDQDQVALRDTLGFGFPPDITFFKVDLENDGKPELISIFRWYIINGDNYELDIYKIEKR